VRQYLIHVAWVQSIVATLGSLYFSEIAKYAPCSLCWYQRIAMYPLVAILLVGVLSNDKRVRNYVLPLSVIGFGIAFYHNLLYYNLLPGSNEVCQLGVSCTTAYIEWFGFLTIPLLSLIAFTVITLCLVLYKPNADEDEEEAALQGA
jgi:disulfide bond formation protein DsbB